MALSIELEFDKKTDKMIRAIWRDMSEAGISTFLHHSTSIPHITLCIYEDAEDEKAFCAAVRSFKAKANIPEIYLNGVGVFGGEKKVIYLSAAVTDELLKLHREFYQHMTAFNELAWPQYQPGAWVPHASVAMQPDPVRIGEGVEIALKHFVPAAARVTSIGIIHMKPLKHIEHMDMD